MNLIRIVFLSLIALSACSTESSTAKNSAEITVPRVPLAVQQSAADRQRSEATGKKWMVSTQGKAATEAVREIYAAGGNMIDAAVAASFAISVERPQSTGIGGGGFLLYRDGKTGKVYAIDFRERAPPRAHAKMFVDEKGEVIPEKSTVGTHAAGVPGLVKGLAEIHAKFGRLPFAKTVAPAIRLAEEGFPVYPYLANALAEEKETIAKFPSTAKIHFRDGRPLKLGETLVQNDLANTLREIARTQGKAFYSGAIAEAIETTTHGWISRKDLKDYKVMWRDPVRGTFRGNEIISMSPPSSGGTHVIEILNILENKNLATLAPRSAESIHLQAAAMQSTFVDRARYMGDPAFVKVPVAELTSKSYALKLADAITPAKALNATERAAVVPQIHESSDTTHLSIIDAEGNMVATTQSVNGWFGNYEVVPGTGILLNNTMDDFAAKPGARNIFGAVGSVANLVAAKKTPLSSMSPTFVLRDGQPVMAVGAPGGTRIITCVMQTILNYLEFKLPLYESVAMVRIHHQWYPDELVVENPGVGAEVPAQLAKMGYAVKPGSVGCAVMAVTNENGVLHGVSDPRDSGMALGL